MKRIKMFVVFGLLLALLASCATDHKVALSQNKNVIGKNGIKRPDWVMQDQSSDKDHYASGYGKGKTFETSMLKAKLNADAALATWIGTSVEAIRDRYIEESDVDSKETYIDTFVSKAKEAGQAVLSGVTEVDFWEDNEGGVWVLHSIPVENVKAQIHGAINTVFTDTSLFTNTDEAEKTFERLNQALNTYFPEI
jgi:hypothetical protein